MKPVGHVDEITRYSISGWAADEDLPGQSVHVVISQNGRDGIRVHADIFREGLTKASSAAHGKHGFQYSFNPPLSPFRRCEVQVRVEGAAKTLPRGHAVLEPVASDAAGADYRPSNAILLSTSGRSGSTVMMGILAGHPQIVVADVRPFEVELLCYYSYAYRVLVAAGDHNASLRPDRITAVENRYKIGFNPYTAEGFKRHFANPALFNEFFLRDMPKRLSGAFRDIILDYYTAVAQDKAKQSPLYFAEKSLPEHEVRQGARHIFGRIREVVLVRDLRDVVCSFVNSAGTDFERTVAAVRSSGQRFLEIEAAQGHDVHFVRYEDLVTQPDKTLLDLYAFLGLNAQTHLTPDSLSTLFTGHATSRSPAASIGRWQRDLSGEQLELCRTFAPFLEKFGYDPLPHSGVAVPAFPAPEAVEPAPQPADMSADPHQLPLSELMAQFESLGENCEFGLVQRRCGIEPLGLLRFSSTPLPPLMKALAARFTPMGQAGLLEVELGTGGREYMIFDKAFGFRYHAWASVGEMEPEAVKAREVRRLPLLIRKLTEDLTEGRKLFVYHAMHPMTEAQARDLAAALRLYGPATLLWVELEDEGNPPGTVVRLAPGLLKGHMNRFAPGDDAHDLSLDCWITVCRNAWALAAPPQRIPAAAMAATA